MWVKTIELFNWLPFKGRQKIDLKPGVYSVFAEVKGEVGRSNWSGKTAFLEAILFALYGVHRKRSEDDWITADQIKGSVKLTLSDDTQIKRSRIAGKSTVLEVLRGGERILGKQAQMVIDEHVGLTKDDFRSTMFVAQKDIARIIYESPGERAKEFLSWMDLTLVREAEQAAKDDLRRFIKETEDAAEDYNNAVKEVYSIANSTRDHGDWNEYIGNLQTALRVDIEVIEKRYKTEDVKIDDLKSKHRERKTLVKRWDEASRTLGAMRVRERSLRAKTEELSSANAAYALQIADLDEERQARAKDRLSDVRKEIRTVKDLIGGEFSGECPVTRNVCPVADMIRKEKDSHKVRLAKLKRTYKEVSVEVEDGTLVKDSIIDLEKEIDGLTREIRILKKPLPNVDQAISLLREYPSRIEYEDSDILTEISTRMIERKRLWVRKDRCLQSLDSLEKFKSIILGYEQAKIESDKELIVLNAARRLLGRSGLQSEIAKTFLHRLVKTGNELLVAEGIKLEFDIDWNREGKGLADDCSACGSSFPRSAKIKVCSTCGAKRGKKIVEETNILFSDRSGGAEDIIGGVVRLSGSYWFRKERHSDWGVMMIDEPFGALDEFNRVAFASLLAKASKGGFALEQLFVVAHHPDVQQMYEKAILIVRDGELSKIQVIDDE